MKFDSFTKSLLLNVLNEEGNPYAFESDTSSEPEEEYVKSGKKKKKEQPEAQPFHGMALTPEAEAGIKTTLKYGGDDPETIEKEVSTDTSWQGVNAASFNEIKRQRMEQEQKLGMKR